MGDRQTCVFFAEPDFGQRWAAALAADSHSTGQLNLRVVDGGLAVTATSLAADAPPPPVSSCGRVHVVSVLPAAAPPAEAFADAAMHVYVQHAKADGAYFHPTKAFYNRAKVGQTGSAADTEIVECTPLWHPPRSALYSRSHGLLESSVLEAARVAIVGVGSGGSYVAVELAKAGVGNFVLVEFDRLEVTNVVRHQCGLEDVGRLKSRAVKDLILAKNPFANVDLLEYDITQLASFSSEEKALLKSCNLMLVATDNVQSRYVINEFCLENNITAIYAKCNTRACGGDVMRVRPSEAHYGCFACIYSEEAGDREQITSVKQARAVVPVYMADDDVHALVQVGLSSDIIPVANHQVKLALVELSREHAGSGLSQLAEDLAPNYYMWVNRRENEHRSFPPGCRKFNLPAILRWYGADRGCLPHCASCLLYRPEVLGLTRDEARARLVERAIQQAAAEIEIQIPTTQEAALQATLETVVPPAAVPASAQA